MRRFDKSRLRRSTKDPDPGARIAQRVARHVERHVGPVVAALGSTAINGLQMDVLWVRPDKERPCHTLVTCGMASRPMVIEDPRDWCSPLAELVLRLKPDWPIGPGASRDMRVGWPIEELFQLAHLPHREGTHLGVGHTVTTVDPDGRTVSTMCKETRYHGWVLRTPDWAPEPFRHLRVGFRERIDFLSAVPVYEDELKLAFDEGSPSLLDHLDRSRVGDILVPDRPSVFTSIH